MDPEGGRSKIEEIKKIVQYYEGKMMQQIIAYLSFQCIILAFISQSQTTRIRCRHWWLPFSLSLLSALYFAILISDSFFEYLKAHFQLSSSNHSSDVLNVVIDVLSTQEEDSSPSTPDNNLLSAPPTSDPLPTPLQNIPQQETKMFRPHMVVYSTIVFTAAVTIILWFACHFVLCGAAQTQE